MWAVELERGMRAEGCVQTLEMCSLPLRRSPSVAAAGTQYSIVLCSAVLRALRSHGELLRVGAVLYMFALGKACHGPRRLAEHVDACVMSYCVSM